MNVRELAFADIDEAVAFANQHFCHPLFMDSELTELTVRASLARRMGRFVAAENGGGLLAMVHCARKAPGPPFHNRYLFDIIAADRAQASRQALVAALSVAMDSAVAEANCSETLFHAVCDAGDTILEDALQEAGFADPETFEMGMVLLKNARALPAPEGVSARPAKPEDAARISEMSIALMNPLDWLPENWVAAMVKTGAVILVAEAEGRIVGAAGGKMLGPGKATGLMNMIDTDYQSKGVGSFLFSRFSLELTARGGGRVPGMVESEAQRRFYQRLGWEHIKEIRAWRKTVS